MGKAFSKKELTEIKERIFVESERIFTEKGLKRAGLQEITSSAGIALGSFYRFFVSKEQLFVEILNRYNAETLVVQTETLKRQIHEGKFCVEELIQATFDTYKKKPVYLMIFEKNEEYDYLLSKLSDDNIKENILNFKVILNYLFDEAEKHWTFAPNYSRDVVAGLVQYMFIGLVNRKIIGEKLVEEVIKANALIIRNYLETGKFM